ncbi:MAG: hypothetical protein H7Y60_19130 [Rhodospirillaceae bacterium]|nr:hypothetical protein [Rhodospirillales bacterium]
MRLGILGAAALCMTLAHGIASAKPLEASRPNATTALTNTYWYVPTAYLPALRYDPNTGTGAAISDQTVWRITHSADGYFWGDTAAVFSGDNAGAAGKAPSCSKMVGTLTPSGDALISFVNSRSSTTGIGRLKDMKGEKVFQMQMSAGEKTMTLHWADMARCQPGQACWSKLPGSDLGIEAFLAQCDAQ